MTHDRAKKISLFWVTDGLLFLLANSIKKFPEAPIANVPNKKNQADTFRTRNIGRNIAALLCDKNDSAKYIKGNLDD